MIKEINRQMVKVIREKMHMELQKVADELGVDISLGNGTFTSADFRIRVDVRVRETKDGKNPKELEFERYSKEHQRVNSEWFGKEFEYEGKTYKIVGINKKAHKKPVELEDSTGKKYKASPEMVKRFLGEK